MKVLPHAVRRYYERSGCDPKKSYAAIEKRLLKIVEKGVEWELLPDKRLMQLLNNKCIPARYYKQGEMMVVVENDLLINFS